MSTLQPLLAFGRLGIRRRMCGIAPEILCMGLIYGRARARVDQKRRAVRPGAFRYDENTRENGGGRARARATISLRNSTTFVSVKPINTIKPTFVIYRFVVAFASPSRRIRLHARARALPRAIHGNGHRIKECCMCADLIFHSVPNNLRKI